MSGGHTHGGAMSAGGRHKSRLAWAFALTATFFAVEVTAGLLTNSLALLSDAGHMLTDVVGLGMALAAIQAAASRPSPTSGASPRTPSPTSGASPRTPSPTSGASPRTPSQHSFGLYRLEILAALANAVLLFGVAVYVLVEAANRITDPPEVLGAPMLAVAVAGLAANLVAFALLREGAKESLNIKGAYLEVLADTIGSVGVIIAAIVLLLTGWPYADPLLAAGIGLFILPRAWRLAGEALHILVQACPGHVSLDKLRGELAALDGVVDVHDLHVWTLTSAMDVASVHLMVNASADAHGVLDRARDLLRHGYGIDHATLQVEPDTHEGCDELHW